uniref:Uncharacterized protein n=1 Tax=Arundo donax TaxID=35708 RepID=A0A0A9EST3_ARUDO
MNYLVATYNKGSIQFFLLRTKTRDVLMAWIYYKSTRSMY